MRGRIKKVDSKNSLKNISEKETEKQFPLLKIYTRIIIIAKIAATLPPIVSGILNVLLNVQVREIHFIGFRQKDNATKSKGVIKDIFTPKNLMIPFKYSRFACKSDINNPTKQISRALFIINWQHAFNLLLLFELGWIFGQNFMNTKAGAKALRDKAIN